MMKTMWFLLPLIANIEYCNTEIETESFYDKMTCADCRDVNTVCNITTVGWVCEYAFDAKKLIDNGNSSDIPNFLRTCMIPGMEFVVEETLFSYCCFWSPEIGCQKLKQINKKTDRCYRCTRATYSELMVNTSCPCGEFFQHSESRGIIPKPGHFLCITFIIILNLQTLNNKQ